MSDCPFSCSSSAATPQKDLARLPHAVPHTVLMAKLSWAEDLELRQSAMNWLEQRTHDGSIPIHKEDFKEFEYHGKYLPLRNPQMGIHKPKGMNAALSITTTYTTPGNSRPYADEIGPDGAPRYKWEKTDPSYYTNASLRLAMQRRLPIIWFWGIGESLYDAIFPVFLVGEEPSLHQFIVSVDGTQGAELLSGMTEEVSRRYRLRETKQRLHQPVFRSMVLRAYRTRCAICKLGHSSLLDAAHIIDDSSEAGIAAVRNGMTLCKIHHAAFDSGILGVDPHYRISIREDILEEVDGPILEFGLKRAHGTKLSNMPATKSERPSSDLLEVHFEQFKSRTSFRETRHDYAFPARTNSPFEN